ncbi:unnamed protein product [Lactuca saligna]|uniref:Uncharacterized protein n=1 Tax=Lactuca saligna TaxID=75948 RepID=A0AA35V1K3_LACSI|nr:unnamed protein product [Lactuca saligna]
MKDRWMGGESWSEVRHHATNSTRQRATQVSLDLNRVNVDVQSFYVMNFPDYVLPNDLWKVCSCLGKIVDGWAVNHGLKFDTMKQFLHVKGQPKIIWFDVEGLPLKARSKDTFQKIIARWCTIVHIDDDLREYIYKNRVKEAPGWTPSFPPGGFKSGVNASDGIGNNVDKGSVHSFQKKKMIISFKKKQHLKSNAATVNDTDHPKTPIAAEVTKVCCSEADPSEATPAIVFAAMAALIAVVLHTAVL